MVPAEADWPRIALEKSGGTARLNLHGVWKTMTVGAIDTAVRKALAEADTAKTVTIDLRNVTAMDTAGAWLVVRSLQALQDRGLKADLAHVPRGAETLIEAVQASTGDRQSNDGRDDAVFWRRWLATVGQGVYAMRGDALMGLNILGAAVRGSQMKSGYRNSLPLAPVANQIDRMGLRAIPIIVLMSFIIGAIIAQQGAFQLRYFGAEIFVVDLVAILVLREIGVLLTAIMIAGRSGSAITAEIGSMKMREEVDALTVIGLNPVGVLVFPRLLALVIALPLLAFIANIAALAGAMFVAQAYSGISPDAFLERMRAAVDLSTLFAGLIKAPFMAIIIGIIASVEGMKVGGSAESLGERVTAAVVKSIFVVIVVDGLFAMFYAAINF